MASISLRQNSSDATHRYSFGRAVREPGDHFPESDPSHPRYEPPHLRHQPGDTWEIGGRLDDPWDPGPVRLNDPTFQPDTRTGRHRRGELPDPYPPGEGPARPPITPTPPALEPTPPPQDHRRDGRYEGEPPSPYRRRHRRWGEPETEEPYRFSPMRETAMRRFLEFSQPFRDAHFEPDPPSLRDRIVWTLRWLLWVAACGLAPMPRPLTQARKPESAELSHWREVPRQTRSAPSSPAPAPYMAAWEHAFDANHGYGGGVTA